LQLVQPLRDFWWALRLRAPVSLYRDRGWPSWLVSGCSSTHWTWRPAMMWILKVR